MVINFYLRYKTKFGQSLFLHIDNAILNVDDAGIDIPLTYLNDEYWHVDFDTAGLNKKASFQYYFILKETGNADLRDYGQHRSLNLKKLSSEKEINIIDDWQDFPIEDIVFDSKPFLQVFSAPKLKTKDANAKNPSHIFEVMCTYLPDDKMLCVSGSGKKMKDWDSANPVLLKKRKNTWSVKLNLSKENFPLEYKFGIYDINEKKVIHFEPGNNRLLHAANKDNLSILHQFVQFPGYAWKGAGVNIQLSALKSEHSWGIGDFTDLNLLTDWAHSSGIKLIQLLPVNDTTASRDQKDSYPYSAISAFALNPAFLNVQKLAIAASLEFPDELQTEIQELNELPHLDYERVAGIKTQAILELFEKDKMAFKDDFAYFDFFDLNRHWLVPYAVFCYLRDKYLTADFSEWEAFSTYDEEKIQEFASPEQEHYHQVAIHYFTQYHLHLQLQDAVEYAHKKGIILKGDLPIGVGRFSVDTWMHPELFHLHMQAGAPPDAFTIKGQNWSFPTYNWELMKKDDYPWWRQRMEHMSNYFDAIRIDHILGFFRIWSIPMHAIEGVFGRFMPAWPLHPDDFQKAGIHFNESRLCDPYFTNDLPGELFGEDAQWVKDEVLQNGKIKEQFNTQQKVIAYLDKYPKYNSARKGLFDLLANVILLKDESGPGLYHFRINMQDTVSFKHLPGDDQHKLNELYRKYFFENQNDLWYKEAQNKLDAIQRSTSMLICAEDLGMVPAMVEDVLKTRKMLSLQVQRMPKKTEDQFTHPADASYLSVVTPSTHDMSTVREWWEENPQTSQSFYNNFLGHHGTAPFYCEPWICKDIILQHLNSPAMWSVFLLQDLLATDENIRREKPSEERINIPADPNHYWNYRMHITLEFLIQQEKFSDSLKFAILQSGR